MTALTDALGEAYWRTRTLLTESIDLVRIAILALLVFVANCSAQVSANTSSHGTPGMAQSMDEAFIEVVGVGASVTAVTLWVICITTVYAGLLFLSSRASMMLVDSVATLEPRFDAWNTHSAQANALWRFRLAAMLVVVVATYLLYLVVNLLGVGVTLMLPDAVVGTMAMTALRSVGLLLLPAVWTFYALDFLARDLAAPALYATRGDSTVAALKLVVREVETPSLVVYLLLRLVVGFVIDMVSFALLCVCCCIILIPGMWAVILLPLVLYLRAVTLLWFRAESAEFASLIAPREQPEPTI